jgi:hypothetical protein
MRMSSGVQLLRAKIRGLQAEGVTIRRRIAGSCGPTRNEFWERKRMLGAEARYHFLAYGLLRGRTYRQIEAVGGVNRGHGINAAKLLELVKAHERFKTTRSERGGVRLSEWTLADIERFLRAEEVANA